MTRRKKTYIQCLQFKTGPTRLFSDGGPATSSTERNTKMGEDIIKGGEPPPKKKKAKKKAAPKKAAKKKAAKK